MFGKTSKRQRTSNGPMATSFVAIGHCWWMGWAWEKETLRASCHLLLGCSEPLCQVFLIIYTIELVIFQQLKVFKISLQKETNKIFFKTYFVKICLILSKFVLFCQNLSYFANICLFIVNICLFLSIFVNILSLFVKSQ